MTVLETGISWTNSTWNPTTGCTKVSAGCDFCYAEALTNRLWGGGFEYVKQHPKRLAAVAKFTPLAYTDPDGRKGFKPRLVFVNSMSDLMHKDIEDSFRDSVFEAMDTMPSTVFQILTKRPMTLRRYIEARFRYSGVPDNLWLGISVEDNRVKSRIDILREMKTAVGPFTAFLSVEPLIGPCDDMDFHQINQVLIGGESGPNARDMRIEWARDARDLADEAGAAIWFKQFGKWSNNPLYAAANGPRHIDRVRQAIRAGEQHAHIVADASGTKIVGEKGGATLDGKTHHELPPAFARLFRKLNGRSA